MMKWFFVSWTVLLLAGSGAVFSAGGATALYFVEQEPEAAPQRTRIVVTHDFLRIDADVEEHDFLLFSRKERTIYNVSQQDKLILIIKPAAVTIAPPLKLANAVEKDSAELPKIGGKKVRHYRLTTNRELCYDLYAADGLLPDALTALREYRETLAGEHADMVAVTPKEMQTPCDLANNVFAPVRHLAHGFPVRVSETTGRSAQRTTELIDYRTDFDPAKLFELPAAYRRMSIKEFRNN